MKIAPPGAPPCWSRQYMDGDRGCEVCRFKSGCREAIFSKEAEKVIPKPPNINTLGALSQVPPPPAPLQVPVFRQTSAPATQVLPLPVPPPQPQMQIPPPPPMQALQQSVGMFQPQPQPQYMAMPPPPPFSPFHPQTIMQPMQQVMQPQQTMPQAWPPYQFPVQYQFNHQHLSPFPAIPPSYGFVVYEGETVGQRIVKNMLLRAASAACWELTQFFSVYPWLPSRR